MTEKELYNQLEEYDKTVIKLSRENKKLKLRIDKAIEDIEEELNCTPSSNRKEVGLILVDYKKLLKILKGEENE